MMTPGKHESYLCIFLFCLPSIVSFSSFSFHLSVSVYSFLCYEEWPKYILWSKVSLYDIRQNGFLPNAKNKGHPVMLYIVCHCLTLIMRKSSKKSMRFTKTFLTKRPSLPRFRWADGHSAVTAANSATSNRAQLARHQCTVFQGQMLKQKIVI